MKHTTMKHPMIAGLAVMVTSLTVQGSEPKTGPDTPAAEDQPHRSVAFAADGELSVHARM